MDDPNFCPHCGHDLSQYRPKPHDKDCGSGLDKSSLRPLGELDDALYPEVEKFVILMQSASTDLIQRRFDIGYARTIQLIDVMEARAVISSADDDGKREVLMQIEIDDTTDNLPFQ